METTAEEIHTTTSSDIYTTGGYKTDDSIQTKSINVYNETQNKLAFLRKQSVEIGDPASKPATEGLPRRSARFPEGLKAYDNTNIRTLFDNLKNTVDTAPNNNSFGFRTPQAENYTWLTYKQFYDRVLNFGSGLINLGLKPYDKIGVYSINRLEWLIAEQACNAWAMTTVAIYDTFGENAITYVVNHAELPLIVCSADKTSKIIEISKHCTSMKWVVQMEPLTDEQKGMDTGSVKLLSLVDIEQEGKEVRMEPHPPKPNDLAVLMYTSGTTGDPKGVMLTHANIIAAMTGIKPMLGEIYPTDVYLSFLPLAHIFERMAITTMLSVGCSIGFYSGDTRNLVEDINILKPTLMSGVPRVWERIYTKVQGTVESSGFLKKKLFKFAYNKKSKNIKNEHHLFSENESKTKIFNKVVFGKTKARVGGRLRAIISGAAPLAPPVHEFLKVCFGCPVAQGYGLTETCAAGCVSDLDDPHYGHVGAPLVCNEIKLIDVPDMNYTTNAHPPRGEILIRGPNVSIGYYKDEEKTRQDFDDQGWFHTGDIGQWNDDGTLSIIDRKKNIFKLAQGEYIAAERLELVYQRSKFILQIFVYGDSYTPFLIAIIVTEPTYLAEWAAQRGLPNDINQLADNKELKNEILADLEHLRQANKLNGIEAIKGIIISKTEFTPENELATPTLKLKRPQLRSYFDNDIVATYKELGIDVPHKS